MSTQKKDKEKVLDEVWTQDRIESFLDMLPPEGIDADFHALHTAYKSMRSDDFEIFVDLFASRGRNLKAKNPFGESVSDIVAQHAHGTPYTRILESATR